MSRVIDCAHRASNELEEPLQCLSVEQIGRDVLHFVIPLQVPLDV
jgi:hypothetical protein